MPKTDTNQHVVVKGKTFEPFLTQETIQNRIKELCVRIDEHYAGKRPILIGLLNGSFRIMADVVTYLNIPCEISFVKIKSYVGDTSGKIEMPLGVNADIEGRDVILIEDIVDTGKTLSFFIPQLKESKPKSVALFTLLVKPDAMQHEVKMDYVGFAVPNHFLLGYGLDY
ncbi:MAG: hypoxanthine phosphoribosyltransferase, partial [Aureispira sp.]|nr:hypoxanthine phosphoribosyltransferase [Aureispira sp.]